MRLIPENVDIKRDAGKTTITYKRFRIRSIILIFVSGFFLYSFFDEGFDFSFKSLLYTIPFLAIPFLFLYQTIKTNFNSIIITIDTSTISIKEFPIPTRAKQVFPRTNINYVFLKSIAGRSENTSYETYSISIVTNESREVVIIDSINDIVHAKAIRDLIKENISTGSVDINGELI